MVTNPWIDFLRHYGPIPAADNMYDESIQEAITRTGVKPLHVSVGYVDELVANFENEHGASVVLTGTAGDGKTFHCREVWDRLGGTEKAWRSSGKVKELSLGSRSLRVIKDLSELSPSEQMPEIQRMADVVLGKEYSVLYLVAANDGQLMDAWETVWRDGSSAVREAWKVLEMLLVDELPVEQQKQRKDLRVWLYNLSRQDTPSLYDELLQAVLEHQDWEACDQCPHSRATQTARRCPILENRERLRNDNGLFRIRLRNLVSLADANGLHMPIRHLLLLFANILLGHHDARDRLMNCRSVGEILEKDTVEFANPYANAFGANLPASSRRHYTAFATLNTFSIGSETSNRFDDLLVYGPDNAERKRDFDALVATDGFYGHGPRYEELRKEYVDGSREDPEAIESFLDCLCCQRQRLFFTIPPEYQLDYDIWQLTVYSYAGSYLDLQKQLSKGKEPKVHLRHLIKGLNRVFTGLMAGDDDSLILAVPGAHTYGRVSRIYKDRIPMDGALQNITLTRGDGGIPQFVVDLGAEKKQHFKLYLTHYDYLRRISDGSLPTTFSHQCYEDLLGFKTRLLGVYEKLKQRRDSAQDVFDILELDRDGRIRVYRIEVLNDE